MLAFWLSRCHRGHRADKNRTLTLAQAWDIAHTPQQVCEVLLGAYRGSANPKLLTGVQKALRPFAASLTHLPGAHRAHHCCAVN